MDFIVKVDNANIWVQSITKHYDYSFCLFLCKSWVHLGAVYNSARSNCVFNAFLPGRINDGSGIDIISVKQQ